MNDTTREIASGPAEFELSEEEANIAAARAGFRRALRKRFSLRHVAPLVAFVLLTAFAAILALTGLIARRPAESLIIVAAIAFMVSRLAAHWRLRSARSTSAAAIFARRAAPMRIVAEATGLRLETASGVTRLDYRDCRDAESTGALIYLWSVSDEPAVIPIRAFSSEEAAGQFLALVRAGLKRAGAGH
jgi:hypothetical protein